MPSVTSVTTGNINTRAKGRKAEKKAEAALTASGWEVCLVQGSRSWNASVDFFNRFDIIAVAPKAPYVRWIQVKASKTGYPPGLKERTRLGSFRDLCGVGSIELWVYKDRVKEPRVIDLR